MTPAQRLAIRRKFASWRKAHNLSYQDIVDQVNAKGGAGIPELRYPTVTSWGVRGAIPGPALSKALRRVFPDCPMIV